MPPAGVTGFRKLELTAFPHGKASHEKEHDALGRATERRCAAYKGIVRPLLEYCAPVWSPHQLKYTHMLEMIQRRAARFTLNKYHNTSSVTNMLHDLGWESLQSRRTRIDFTTFYKIQHGLAAVPIPPIVQRPQRTRPDATHRFQAPYCSTEAYRHSFFRRVIRQWNLLPVETASLDSLSTFKAVLAKHPF